MNSDPFPVLGRLLSVNVGIPRDVAWEGKTVRTAIWKQPVDGVAMLHAFADAHDSREVWWIHGARDGRHRAFRPEVDELLASLPHAHRIAAYSRPAPDDILGRTSDAAGRIGIETIEDAGIPADADVIPARDPPRPSAAAT